MHNTLFFFGIAKLLIAASNGQPTSAYVHVTVSDNKAVLSQANRAMPL